jgi:hypothetical protein
MNSLYNLLLQQDLSPKLIGKFSKETKNVTITIIGQNGPLDIINSTCFPIANTTRWSWSIKNIPNGEYKYLMISDLAEFFEGDFHF